MAAYQALVPRFTSLQQQSGSRWPSGVARASLGTVDNRTPLASHLMYAVFVAWLGFDMAVKAWTEKHLAVVGQPSEGLPYSIPFIKENWMALTHVKNTGGAWSILAGNVGFLALVAGVVVVFIMAHERSLAAPRWWQAVGLGLLLGGSVGNYVDRIRFAGVTDMFDMRWPGPDISWGFIQVVHGQNWFPIYNIADIGINIGIVMLVLGSMRQGRAADA
ncbi:MAG: signal peptidase II [Candidatus Sericytochromatia bacterium]|nr:signal peptidase II [Candidatus Sericytochromatia bacterium]